MGAEGKGVFFYSLFILQQTKCPLPSLLYIFLSSSILFICQSIFHPPPLSFLSLSSSLFSSIPSCFSISINLVQGPSIIHLPSREVFPEGKLLWRPVWPRTASDWPSACLPFCILHCLFNKEQSECDFQGRVPVIVALTPCLSNDPHYGASDSSLKGLIYEYAGNAAPQASVHQPLNMVSPPSASVHRPYIHVRGRSHTHTHTHAELKHTREWTANT